ncbi:MAG: hypothetical protein HQ557_09650 [Bacteroidetes bacterium]|nr:hypothetical protein [Bacteroidota bacterium]
MQSNCPEDGGGSLDKITCLGSCFATAGNRASLRLKEAENRRLEEVDGRRKIEAERWINRMHFSCGKCR